MRIILLGSGGQLGYEFEKFLKGKEEIYSFPHSKLDILDFESLVEIFKKIKPHIVINCAAYTKVDEAEENKDLALKVNAVGARNVSFASFKIGAKVVYFSTDYVFDGNKNSPYTEFDEPNPISIYGESKYLGEKLTERFNPNHLILRISWLYGIKGTNFVRTIIKISKEKKFLRIVNDQIGTPTYTLDVVKQAYLLLKRDYVGLFHSSNNGETTWFEFAKKINLLLNLGSNITPIETKDYPTKAKRPKYSVLENYLLKLDNLDIMRKWEVALEDFLSKYKKELLNG